MTQTKREQDFLSIIRLGIGHSVLILPKDVEWPAIKALAEEHGLMGVLIDGIERLPESLRSPKDLLLEWIGEVLKGYEYRFDLYRKAISELAGFYNSQGLRMMIIKGYACSLDWPNPSHRPCGDIDIWLFGTQKEADVILARKKGIQIDSSHHHHTVFDWKGFVVENHYDFINVHHHKSNAELEKILKKLGQDDTLFTKVNGEKIFLPSPNLHALFLLKHIISHFASECVNLRQVLDRGFFVKKHTKDVDWKWLDGILERNCMKEFHGIINAICVKELGFHESIFSYVQFVPHSKDRVFNDVLNPEFADKKPLWFLPRMIFRYRRWMANAWKHRLCYKDSMWSAFWSGVWNHLLKPASI